MFYGIAQQVELFDGYYYDLIGDKIGSPDGRLLKRSQFDILFGGHTFVLDHACERVTRKASEAFLRNQTYWAPRKAGESIQLIGGCTFVSIDGQLEMFAGYALNVRAMRVVTPDGMLLSKSRFNALFGPYVFSMDANNEYTTRNAWEAFTMNSAYRPPIVA